MLDGEQMRADAASFLPLIGHIRIGHARRPISREARRADYAPWPWPRRRLLHNNIQWRRLPGRDKAAIIFISAECHFGMMLMPYISENTLFQGAIHYSCHYAFIRLMPPRSFSCRCGCASAQQNVIKYVLRAGGLHAFSRRCAQIYALRRRLRMLRADMIRIRRFTFTTRLPIFR